MDRIVNISIVNIIDEAQKALTGKWGTVLGAFLVYILVSMVSGIIPFLSFVIEGPLSLGMAIITLNIVRNRAVSVGALFDGFNNFAAAFGLLILTTIVVILGFILFIIPGVILALGLSQVFNVLADNPKMPIIDVMKKSYEMMKGYKVTYFLMSLVFVLMMIATVFTLGLGLIWVVPVITVAHAKFYTVINNDEGLSIEDNLIE